MVFFFCFFLFYLSIVARWQPFHNVWATLKWLVLLHQRAAYAGKGCLWMTDCAPLTGAE